MSNESGNAENVNKQYADFLGNICRAIWPALKPVIKKSFDNIQENL